MKLEYTPEQRAFRMEVRAWMEANVPRAPLPSFDLTREGFEAHRDWERKLNQGRWGMVTWPEQFVAVPEMPMTPTRKVIKSELVRRFLSERASGSAAQ